ncbi:hypothetical protein FACS1894122_13720 [Alphaproteobacteria bacterium]|nr:hypothetical protein FACS1894122_13720 [Alphaproteobacteria bacterium]
MYDYCGYIEYFIEAVFGFGMFINAVLFLPQAVKIYKTKNTDGISLATFAGFCVIQFFTVLHGYIHQDHILMFGSVLGLIFCAIVTFLIIIYKNSRGEL